MVKAAIGLQPFGLSIRRAFERGSAAACAPALRCFSRIARRQFASSNARSVEYPSSTVQSGILSTVGSSALQTCPLTPTRRHIHILSFIACVVAVSSTWLFCTMIPAILAFKRSTELLKRKTDILRENLPDTMAAARLSGMEISELTAELGDLGQEITQGVRNSTQAVRIAEERLRQLVNMTRHPSRK